MGEKAIGGGAKARSCTTVCKIFHWSNLGLQSCQININSMSVAPRAARYISEQIIPAVLVSGSAKSALYSMLLMV